MLVLRTVTVLRKDGKTPGQEVSILDPDHTETTSDFFHVPV